MSKIPLPIAPHSKSFDALEQIKVLDLSTSIAGPYGCQLLADFGAEVVKVEKPLTGDDSRAWGPPFLNGESLWYLSVNRNKSSIVIDMTLQEGRQLLEQLVSQADVLVTNFLPKVQRKLQVDAAHLHQINPRLIHISLTGFGLEGERNAFSCYDLIAEGYSGVMDMTGEINQDPQKIGTPAADLLAGMDLALATMAALIKRDRDQKGHAIDISMVDSMTRFMTPRLISYLGSGIVPRRDGAKDSVIAIYQVFQTLDEPITLGLGNDAIWKRFWMALDEPDFIHHEQYQTNIDRRKHRQQLVTFIQDRLKVHPRKYWLELFQTNNIPAGPINRLDQISSDPEMLKRGMFYDVPKDGGVIPQVGLGIQIDGQQSFCHKPPPALGEDSSEILSHWLSLSKEDIRQLLHKNIIHTIPQKSKGA
jgi:crotonobetainyl-CoA:carnitine CoA-transferase CaiB-like acyl-CoA transferase